MAKSKCPQCKKNAGYAFSKEDTRRYCKEHSKEGMINTKNKHCIADGCMTQPYFNNEGETNALYCKEHSKEGMINIKGKRCIADSCMTQPSYNKAEGTKALYCKKHALDGMIDIKNKRCIADGCMTQPYYNKADATTALYCKKHAPEGMVDIVSKRCITCQTTRANSKYKPNCSRCHFYLHPDDPRIRNYKTKEQAFMKPLQTKYPGIILDKTVAGGCSKRRPDGLLDCLTHSIIVEIDENQHIGYDAMCNNRRTMELFQDLGSRPIVFVRMNPDSYKRDGKRVNSVFTLTKSGELTTNKKEFVRRFDAIVNAVENAISMKPTRAITDIELFYSDE